MKKILIISSASIHTKKFTDMMRGKYKIYVITDKKEMFETCETEAVYEWKKHPVANAFYTKRIVREIDPDLVHIHQVGLIAFYYTFLLHHRCKILLTAWGSDVMEFPYISPIRHRMTTYALQRASVLSSINSVGMISVIKCLTGFKKQVLPINFGIGEFIEFEEKIEDKEPIIYSPRSHQDLYNIEMILRSFAQFVKKEPHWRLLLSGTEDPVNTPRFKQIVQEAGITEKVEFLGHISQHDHAAIMKRSRIVISVPITDGRPISVMEAIASNCTLVCSDILANRELVSEGVNGVIVDHTRVFDIGLYRQVDPALQTEYNRKISRPFRYETAKQEFLKTLERVLHDDNHR
jgi:glycosyltransferase involved in cell wall biosynthesis